MNAEKLTHPEAAWFLLYTASESVSNKAADNKNNNGTIHMTASCEFLE